MVEVGDAVTLDKRMVEAKLVAILKSSKERLEEC